MAKLEVTVAADISEIESLIGKIKHLQTYKLSTGDEQILVDRDDVAKIFTNHIRANIEPERKKGRWIHTRVNSEHSVTGYFLLSSCECSECKVICEQESNFCPNCGAYMRRAKFDGEKGQS